MVVFIPIFLKLKLNKHSSQQIQSYRCKEKQPRKKKYWSLSYVTQEKILALINGV